MSVILGTLHFLNGVLELDGPREIKDVTFLTPMQVPKFAGAKLSIVDVLCRGI